MDDNVREIMFLIVEQLKAYVDGNEDALLELTQILDSGRHDTEIVNQAFEMIFRALEPYAREDFPGESKRKRLNVRVPTGPERALLSSPAYSYFFRLSESGRVSPEQFEEIMGPWNLLSVFSKYCLQGLFHGLVAVKAYYLERCQQGRIPTR